jgi:TIGR03009 family protein
MEGRPLMAGRLGSCLVSVFVFLLSATVAEAQLQRVAPPSNTARQPVTSQPQHAGSQPQRSPGASPQALIPRDPTLERREPAAPFTLNPQEQAQLDWLLARWEQEGAKVKTFECDFTRFDWDPVWRADRPMHVVQGELKYAAPDKGMLRVKGELVDFRWDQGRATGGRFAEGQMAEHWICNGSSIFEYNFQKKQLIEHKLAPEVKGTAISNSPLPFLFGTKANQLRARYFLRVVTPQGVKDQAWLEAHPRYQADAANFRKATLIIALATMRPSAVESVLPNGKSSTVYQFHNVKANARNLIDPFGVWKNNWLFPRTPAGWTRVVNEAAATQASRGPAAGEVR